MRGRLIFVCIVIMSLTACRKELCYTHDQHSPGVRLDIAASWERVWERNYGCEWISNWRSEWNCSYESLMPHIPEGLRLVAYREGKMTKEFNMNPEGKRVVFEEQGEYTFLFYNNDTEYIIYDNLVSSTHATATTRTRGRSSLRSPHEGERIMNQPDMLYGHFVENHLVERKIDTDVLEVEMRPLVYTYYVMLGFSSGYEYVSKAQGILAGMAEAVYLCDGHTGPESATIMFDCEVGEEGLEAKVMTFGVPDYPGDHYNSRVEDSQYMLRLEVLMTNGVYKTFDIDVADQMADQPRGGVIKVDGLVITKEEGGTPVGGGGFGVGVEGWGDSINIPLN